MLKTISIGLLSLSLICIVCSIASAKTVVVSGGGSGGGGGRGGSVKPATVRWVGIITAIKTTADGYSVTLGTSYYAVGTGIVNSDTKIKLNGASGSITGADLRVGDSAQMDVLWPSKIAVKMEVTGTR